jgi:hypothetical protein
MRRLTALLEAERVRIPSPFGMPGNACGHTVVIAGNTGDQTPHGRSERPGTGRSVQAEA